MRPEVLSLAPTRGPANYRTLQKPRPRSTCITEVCSTVSTRPRSLQCPQKVRPPVGITLPHTPEACPPVALRGTPRASPEARPPVGIPEHSAPRQNSPSTSPLTRFIAGPLLASHKDEQAHHGVDLLREPANRGHEPPRSLGSGKTVPFRAPTAHPTTFLERAPSAGIALWVVRLALELSQRGSV